MASVDTPVLRLRLLRELAQRLLWGGLSYALFALLLSQEMPASGRGVAMALAGLLFVLGGLRTLQSYRVVRGAEVERDGERLIRVSRLQSLAFGGFVTYAFWTVRGLVIPECLLLVGVAGLASVSASLFAPFPKLAWLHVLSQLLPVYVWTAFGLTRFGWLLPAFIVIHALAIFQLIRLHSTHFRWMILDQVMLEEQSCDLRLARDAAEKADSAKMSFLANMSHEIRTPLNGIMGLADILKTTALSREHREMLDDIDRSGTHLLSIVNDILDIAKVSSGKLSLERAPFELLLVVRDIASPASALAEAQRLRFTLEIGKDVPRHVSGDAMRLRQVVSNLLSNAVKFTPAGEVRLTVSSPRAGWIRFEVADTGIGLSSEQQASLFQEFHQVDASTTRRFGGTGLGLAISHRLAALMGGRLWVESRLGEGSIFRTELPLDTVEIAAHAPVLPLPEIAALPRGMRVLVAEDNAINRRVICAIVAGAGANVETAENGREAVERHRANCFDTILMDCQMPEMDGYEATARIRALPGAAARVCVIGVTANAFAEDRDRCLRAGMDGYVAKPLTRRSLLAAMAITNHAECS